MSSTPTVYLVSGANRGLGLGLVTALARRENVVVFAGARSPDAATALQELVKQYPGKFHIVKLTSADVAENEAAAAYIKETAGRLDVVIANAGISKSVGPALTTSPAAYHEHFNVNVVGTLVLFQATYPLLQTSTPSPKFIAISSVAGSLAVADKMFPVSPYGISKAAENYLVRRLHAENEGLISVAVHPGEVATDMMAGYEESIKVEFDKLGLPFLLLSVEESAKSVLTQVDKATREADGGQYRKYDGTTIAW
ncbi:hypothetical protein PLICRDRAFT_243937 [Plicaturopsis crispa FD-325 SS-3]|nr:hypothetical protein PLICRDRAFT_243937 [Plicaturopsis crispa FD-325 SS-3]